MTTVNRVAVNSLVQYVRLFLNLVIGLYSVRIILDALGADDYGIYDVIGGVISVLSFVSLSLSQTSIRFLSVNLGKNDVSSIRKTFNDCFWLHFFFSSLLVVVLEITGLFIFDGFLNIQANRIFAAKCVYQCLVLSLFVNVIITPFSSLIIAHEHFVYSSIVNIIDSLLKLAIAYALIYTLYDKLVVYAVLTSCVVLLNMCFYILYLIVKYKNEMLIGKPSVSGLRNVSGFAGWTILDVIGTLATRQGYAVVINKFWGTTANAAFALARQIEGQIFTISAAVIDTMKPQIMKSYGSNDIERMLRLSMTAGKFGFSMMSLVAIPLLVMMPDILGLWLKDVPEYTTSFARLMVFATLCEQLTRGLVYACQATGNIKWFSIIISSCRFTALPLAILFYFIGFPPISAFYIFLCCEALGSLGRIVVMSYISDLRISYFIKIVLLRVSIPFSFSFLFCYYASIFNSFVNIFVIIPMTSLLFVVTMYYIGLNKVERTTVLHIGGNIKRKFKKNA